MTPEEQKKADEAAAKAAEDKAAAKAAEDKAAAKAAEDKAAAKAAEDKAAAKAAEDKAAADKKDDSTSTDDRPKKEAGDIEEAKLSAQEVRRQAKKAVKHVKFKGNGNSAHLGEKTHKVTTEEAKLFTEAGYGSVVKK